MLMTTAQALGERRNVEIPAPSLDRWMYPFAGSPGAEGTASTFGAFGTPSFDNRDGQLYVRFSTGTAVEPGLDIDRYQIVSATVIIENDNDVVFAYDDTLDPWTCFLAPEDPAYTEDVDDGSPVELWFASFRNGFSATTFAENGPFSTQGLLGKSIRSVYAAGPDGVGGLVDVSNSVDEGYDPTPLALASIDGLAPGDLVPAGSKLRFEIALDAPGVHDAFAAALSVGELPLAITSLKTVAFMGGSFARLRTKENGLVQAGLASAARLSLVVDIRDDDPADLDGDGNVDGADLAVLLGQWGSAGNADFDGSGAVDGADLAFLLGAWN